MPSVSNSHPIQSKQRFTAELAALFSLSAPIIAAQISHSAMGLVDTVMAGRVSSLDLAAVAMGAGIWHPVFLFMLGVLMAVTPSVAHLHGAQRPEEIGHHVRQAMLLGLTLSVLLLIPLRHPGPLLRYLEVDSAAIPLTVAYLRGFSWGMPAIAGYFVLRHFSEGLSVSRPGMLIGFLGLAVNIPANYILIYGKLGFPPLGGAGCGWATALTSWVMFLAMAATVQRGARYRMARLLSTRPRLDRREIGQILRLGLPIGFSMFVESSIFAVIALLIGSLGADVVAAHQITLSFTALVFMIPMSLSSAISVRVGHALGQGSAAGARHAGRVGIAVAIAIACCTSTLCYLFPEPVAAIYTRNPQVAEIAVGLLALAALFQVSDATQVSAAGALRGYKDTRIPMALQIFSYWGVGFPLGYTLGLTSLWGEPMGASGFWVGLIAGLTTAAILLTLRLRVVERQRGEIPSKATQKEGTPVLG